MIKSAPLYELANIQPSYVARDEIPMNSENENVRILTIRDLVQSHTLNWHNLPSGSIPADWFVHCLRPGDVVLPSRGERYYATSFEGADRPVLPSGYLNLIRVGRDLLPDYLAWYLNRASTQERLATLLTGTNIKALNKASLKELSIEVPSLALQRRIAGIDGISRRIAQLRNRLNEVERAESQYLTEHLFETKGALT
jgi:hypothetical protein